MDSNMVELLDSRSRTSFYILGTETDLKLTKYLNKIR